MLKYGTVTEVDPKGFVRVQFDEDEIVSALMPVVFPGTLKNKFYFLPDINDHVAVLTDKHAEDCVCLGSIYSEADTAPFTDANIQGVKYENGDLQKYNRTSQVWSLQVGGLLFQLSKDNGFTIKKGTETLKKLMQDTLTKAEAVVDANIALTVGTGTGSSSPPLNVATFTTLKADIAAIKTRVNSFFET